MLENALIRSKSIPPATIAPAPFRSNKLPTISSTEVSTARRRKPIGSPMAYEKNWAMYDRCTPTDARGSSSVCSANDKPMNVEHTMNFSVVESFFFVHGTKNSHRKSPLSHGSSVVYSQRRALVLTSYNQRFALSPTSAMVGSTTATGARALLGAGPALHWPPGAKAPLRGKQGRVGCRSAATQCRLQSTVTTMRRMWTFVSNRGGSPSLWTFLCGRFFVDVSLCSMQCPGSSVSYYIINNRRKFVDTV